MSATSAKPRAATKKNGTAPAEESALATAIAHEEGIRQEADELRGDATELDRELFLKLWPLLRRPIPAGFIQHVGVVTGKPYESTGVKSLQVLIDRMNNVLTPLCWWYEVEFLGEDADLGKLAEVTVYVGDAASRGSVLCHAVSRGGVNQASTLGNRFKGSETNAAKRAFAQIGPGHEVYLGATDLDPDVSEDAAKAQEAKPGSDAQTGESISAERAENLLAIVKAADLEKHLASKLRGFGAKSLEQLTLEQAMKIWEWVEQSKAGEQPQLDEA